MAESVDLDVQLSGEFRRRQHSFHSVQSYHLKTAAKRHAAAPLDFPVSQRARLDDDYANISVSAPISSLTAQFVSSNFPTFPSTTLPSVESATDSDGSASDVRVDGMTGGEKTESPQLLATVPADIVGTKAASDLSEVLEEVEEVEEVEEEEDAPKRIVRPEDISLHNPDSGLGYRASHNEYHTDDSDDGHDDEDEEEKEGGVACSTVVRGVGHNDADEEEKEKEGGDSDETSHPDSPREEHEIFVPRSPSPGHAEFPVGEAIENGGATVETLPFNTPLDLQLSFDPSVPMGLLMIDPSHQDRFNQLADGAANPGFTAYETLLQQYETENATRLDQIENALRLNTDLDQEGEEEYDEEVEEIIEEIEEEEDLPLPPANPPSSPAFLPAQ